MPNSGKGARMSDADSRNATILHMVGDHRGSRVAQACQAALSSLAAYAALTREDASPSCRDEDVVPVRIMLNRAVMRARLEPARDAADLRAKHCLLWQLEEWLHPESAVLLRFFRSVDFESGKVFNAGLAVPGSACDSLMGDGSGG
jgi:hypothetical protein